jgi:hypothetical protein
MVDSREHDVTHACPTVFNQVSSHSCRWLFHCDERPQRRGERSEAEETFPQYPGLQAAHLQFLSIAERRDVCAARHHTDF